MRKSLRELAVIVMMISGVIVLGVSVKDARKVFDDFIRVFWDPDAKYFYTYSDRKIHEEHAAGPKNGLYADFWWEAQCWQVVMDAYEVFKDEKIEKMIDDVFDGFVKFYPTFDSSYNDDLNWWAIGSVRAYMLTKKERYLSVAIALVNRIRRSLDEDLGGGIWWNTLRKDQKNMVTNAGFVIGSVWIWKFTKDESLLEDALSVMKWVDDHLVYDFGDEVCVIDHLNADGSEINWQFSYNYGVYIGANLMLYDAMGNKRYLEKAKKAAKWLTENMSMKFEGDGDAGGFKGIAARYLAWFHRKYGIDDYKWFLEDHADLAVKNRRSSDGITGPDISEPPDEHEAVQVLSAAAGVAVILSSF